MMREDKQLLMIAHLSQLLTLASAFGSLIIPLAIWLTQRDNVFQMDSQGNGSSDGKNEEDGITDADLDNLILAQDTDVISDARVDVRA